MTVSDEQRQALARALLESRQPKPPSGPFNYGPAEAIARAKQGSLADARLLLLLGAAMLRKRAPIPFDSASFLPAWLADYFAEALDAIGRDEDPAKALGVVRGQGTSEWPNEGRDAWIAYISDSLKASGDRHFLKTTSQLLARVGFPAPSRDFGWSAKAVGKAVAAHRRRLKYGGLKG